MSCSLSFLPLVLFVFYAPCGPPFGASGFLRGPPSGPRVRLLDCLPSSARAVFASFFSCFSSHPAHFWCSCFLTGSMCWVTPWVMAGSAAAAAAIFAFCYEGVLAPWLFVLEPVSATGRCLGGWRLLWRTFQASATRGTSS